jgi:hypothetical protein
MGNTLLICGVTIQENVPRWVKEQGVSSGRLRADYVDAAGFDADAKPRDIRERGDSSRELDVEGACSRIVSGVQRSAFL